MQTQAVSPVEEFKTLPSQNMCPEYNIKQRQMLSFLFVK